VNKELIPAVRYIPDKQKLRLKSLVFLNREMALASGLGQLVSNKQLVLFKDLSLKL